MCYRGSSAYSLVERRISRGTLAIDVLNSVRLNMTYDRKMSKSKEVGEHDTPMLHEDNG